MTILVRKMRIAQDTIAIATATTTRRRFFEKECLFSLYETNNLFTVAKSLRYVGRNRRRRLKLRFLTQKLKKDHY